MRRERIAPDIIAFNTAISACEKERQWQCALQLLSDARSAALVPTVISYNALISACEKSWQWQPALHLVSEMRQAYLPPSRTSELSSQRPRPRPVSRAERVGPIACSGHTLGSGCCGGSPPRLYELAPRTTYTAAMAACVRRERWECASALLLEMREGGVAMDAVACSVAMSVHSMGLKWGTAVRLLSDMRRGACRPNQVVFGSAISACENGEQWPWTLQLLGGMTLSGLLPNHVTCNAAISACLKGQEWRRAAELFSYMRRLDCLPDVIVHNFLIRTWAKLGEWRHAEELLRKVRQEGMTGAVDLDPVRGSLSPLSPTAGAGRPDLPLLLKLRIRACAERTQWRGAMALFEESAAPRDAPES